MSPINSVALADIVDLVEPIQPEDDMDVPYIYITYNIGSGENERMYKRQAYLHEIVVYYNFMFQDDPPNVYETSVLDENGELKTYKIEKMELNSQLKLCKISCNGIEQFITPDIRMLIVLAGMFNGIDIQSMNADTSY